MKRVVVIISAIFLLNNGVTFSQDSFRIMFYNCENFFDTRDDPEKSDEDFLPSSKYFWTYGRYLEKQRNVSKVISAVGGWEVPAIVGLCEVENDSVIYALTRYSPLKELNYRYICTNSADRRGIDVALLYQRDKFKLLSSISHRVQLERPTRDILHVTGQVISGDTLDVFVCHFPSRLGGEKETELLRDRVALELRKQADSIVNLRVKANIVMMGDFNDYPNSHSLYEILGAKAPNDTTAKYINIMYPLLGKEEMGSHKYESEWGVLDQIIVNRAVVNNSRFQLKSTIGNIFKSDFLLEDDPKYGGKRPYRTYLGLRYRGGFSDHLPVFVDFIVK